MKIVILFMLIGLTHLSAEVRSQNALVSLKLKDATIEQVILEVEKQLKQDFFFSKKEVDVTRKISVNLNQATLDELVRVIFGESFGYRLVDNLIVITPKAVVAKEEEKTILMKGQVVDKGGVPLPGVTVLIEGTTVGCATDIDGKFSLPLPKELKDVVVVFRFVGMETQKVKLADKMCIRDSHKLMAARHSLELSNERYDEARVRYKIGNRSGLEAQQAKIDLNTDSSTYVRQKEALKSAYITLNKLMNTDLQMVNYVQDTILLGPQLVLGTLEQKTLAGNTTLLLAKKDQKISALDLKNARAVLFPTLDFNSGYNYNKTCLLYTSSCV